MCVISIGEILWDVFENTSRIGGAPFNVAAHTLKIGHDAVFISAVGDDESGNQALQELRSEGLDDRFVRRIDGVKTGTVDVRIANGQPRFRIHRPAAYDYLEVSEADLTVLRQMNPVWIYVGTLAQMSSQVREATDNVLNDCVSAKVFYDVNLRENNYSCEVIRSLLAKADVVKINLEELGTLQDLLHIRNRERRMACASIGSTFDISGICVTAGEEGAWWWSADADRQWIKVPGYSISVADAVGAGDAFSAGMIHGFIMEWLWEETLDFANRLGALVASKEGALPEWTFEELTVLARG